MLKSIDDFSVALTDSSGLYRSWTLDAKTSVALHDPLEGHEKLLRRYTDADMHNVLAHLVTLI
jgi:cytochrome c oxidase cbb3-type subunit 3